jgi:hypothetical protein
MLCEFWENIWVVIAAFFAYLTHNKIEPSQSAWISICKYVNEPRASTNDVYMVFPDEFLNTWSPTSEIALDPEQPYRDFFYKKYVEAKETSNAASDLIIAQICPDTAIVRIVENVDPEKDISVLETSSARFLEIEYKCSNQSPITIEVPRSHYLAGNEVLSKAYVLRYLEHMSIFVNWGFKESDYSLRIVDEDSEVFSLNSSQYIKLEQDGYKIMESIVDENAPGLPQTSDSESYLYLDEKEKIE